MSFVYQLVIQFDLLVIYSNAGQYLTSLHNLSLAFLTISVCFVDFPSHSVDSTTFERTIRLHASNFVNVHVDLCYLLPIIQFVESVVSIQTGAESLNCSSNDKMGIINIS
jgi:hypothetical protein